MNARDFLLQTDWRLKRLDKIGTENWITVYHSVRTDNEDSVFYSALIPNDRVPQSLGNTEWDYQISRGQPSCVVWYENGLEQERYEHFSQPGKVQPLVLVRNTPRTRDSYTEILEEFRLFHDLFYDHNNQVFIKYTEDGYEDEVIRVKPKHISVRLKEIRQFLAFKEMHLAIFFDITRFSELEIDGFDESERRAKHRSDTMHYGFFADKTDFLSRSHFKSFSRTHGKKLIAGMTKEQTGIWPYESERQYESFIIGLGENGEEITFSANPDDLANFFGANAGNPFYLTPIFFRKNVLAKYYGEPERYQVHDGYIENQGYWMLRADTNHEQYVIVYLGDLGGLPYGEQQIWRSYNVVPDGTISDVAYKRGILGEFADAEDPAFVFKHSYEDFQNAWHRRYRWDLFKPLSPSDEYLLTGLHIPLTDGYSEFDTQVIALTKLIIDSLNENELSKLIAGEIKSDAKGITKFEAYLMQETVEGSEDYIAFLRQLQSVRSISAAHRKGSNYQKRMIKLGIDIGNLPSEFRRFLDRATQLLHTMNEHFLTERS